jgi:hypothetical protein
MDKELPRKRASNAELMDPNRAIPNRETDEPTRAYEVNERELPKILQSSTETESENREIPNTVKEDPALITPRTERQLDKFKYSMMDKGPARNFP